MKYVIYSSANHSYYKTDSENHWTKEIEEAIHCETYNSALKAIESQFKKKKIKELELQIFYANGEPVEDRSSIFENPEEIMEDLHNAVGLFINSTKRINQLIEYYSNQLSHYDSAQEDILHKIEFDTVIGIEAVRLVKKLKEIRLVRRKIKDQLTFLISLRDNKADSLGSRIENLQKDMENRKYTPRVLKELFE